MCSSAPRASGMYVIEAPIENTFSIAGFDVSFSDVAPLTLDPHISVSGVGLSFSVYLVVVSVVFRFLALRLILILPKGRWHSRVYRD